MRHLLLILLLFTTYSQINCDTGNQESYAASPESCTASQESSRTSFIQGVYDTISSYIVGDRVVKSTNYNCDKNNNNDQIDGIAEADEISILSDYIPSHDDKIQKIQRILNDHDITGEPPHEDVFEYLPMTRRDPVAVGHTDTVELPDGRTTTIKTLAKRPPVFEIENFLTDAECDELIDTARRTKLKKGPEEGDKFVPHRHSKLTTLKPPYIDADFLSMIQGRISAITGIPLYIIEGSEFLKVGSYEKGGFFNAHLDTTGEDPRIVPCCFHVPCYKEDGAPYEHEDCCSFCRYISFMYYLNDVEEGGETAFPLADLSFSEMADTLQTTDWVNLTKNCHSSGLVVKPVKGKAVYWYSRFLDDRGYLASMDKRSYHGGCNVKAGSKWIGINVITSPIYEQRFTLPWYNNITESYRQYVRNLRKTSS